MDEPNVKRAIAFFDGQNLYRHAKDAFGYHHPNFDPIKLFDAVCSAKQWANRGVRFYTGTPNLAHSELWHGYWTKRTLAMSQSGILVTKRPLRYHYEEIKREDGTTKTVETPHEKGIDLRIGLDIVRLARTNQLDVVVIFSQDQDLAEAAQEVQSIAQETGRWIKVASAFPTGPRATATRGIDRTDWFRLDRAFYDACLDPLDYRPKKFHPPS